MNQFEIFTLLSSESSNEAITEVARKLTQFYGDDINGDSQKHFKAYTDLEQNRTDTTNVLHTLNRTTWVSQIC